MVQQRLPAIDGDDGSWGQILNQYLTKEHVDSGVDAATNGGHKNITITAGTASVAPLTFTSGTNLTTAAGGSVEYDGTYYYLTSKPSATAFRRRIAVFDETGGATGDIYYRDSNGYLTKVAIGGSSALLGVSGGVPSWSVASYATAPATNTIAQWDANKNLSANATFNGFHTTAMNGGTFGMATTDAQIQEFTGSTATGHTVKLPTGATITAGAQYTIVNNNTSTGTVIVQSSGANAIITLAPTTSAIFTAVVANPSTAANWDYQYLGQIVSSGKSLSVTASLTLAGTDGQTMTFPSSSDTVVGAAAAQTLTNKVVQKRVVTATFSATPTMNIDTADVIQLLSVTANITSMTTNLSGTPWHGQPILWEFKDNGTAKTITWGAKFLSSGTATLLATTVASKVHRVFTVYDSSKTAHICMAVDATGY